MKYSGFKVTYII